MTDRLTSRRPRSLTTFVISLCCATALLVGGIFTVLLVSIIDQRTANSSAASAADQLSQAFAVERSAVDLETGLRGYLLTQDRAFLSPYYQARSRLPRQLTNLLALARTATERSDIKAIDHSVAAYIDSYAGPLVAMRGRLSRAQAVSVTAMGKRRLDALRAQLSALSATDL
jgi:CHASE3 domain sensor protein